jgi:sugar lactone lactonase YvrE
MRSFPFVLSLLLITSACDNTLEPDPWRPPPSTRPPGNQGPNGEAPDAGAPDAGPQTGQLQFTLSGSTTGPVRLEGPNGFTKELTSSQLLSKLEPGTYTVAAERVFKEGNHVSRLYLPNVVGSPATVAPGEVANLQVSYAARTGSGAMWAVDYSTNSVFGIDDRHFFDLHGWEAFFDYEVVEVSSPKGSGVDQIAFDVTGALWLTRVLEGSIVRYGASQLGVTGTQDPEAMLTGLNSPRGVSFDTDGNLWTASGDTVLRIPAAALVAKGARQAEPDLILSGGMLTARALAFDGAGALYVLSTPDNSLMKFERSQLSGKGPVTVQPAAVFTTSGLDAPQALAFDAAGNLYVSNAPSASTGFLVRFAQGSLQTTGAAQLAPVMRLESGNLTGPRGFAFDEGGNLWVATSGKGTVAYFTASQLSGTGTFSLNATATLERWDGHFYDHLMSVAFNPAPAGLPLVR